MKIFAWITLSIIIFIIFGLIYYLVVGEILFRNFFSRKSTTKRIFNKNIKNLINEHKIDLCWWEKVKFSRIEIKSFDQLTLIGYYHDAGSDKTVVIVHGFGGSHDEMQPYCKFFYEKNFNVLAVDNRAHGESEGKCIGFGWLDRKDIVSWIEYLNSNQPNNKILLFGLSMGATAVCCVAGEKLPTNVCAVISDCAFDNANKQIDFVMRDKKIVLKLFKKHLFGYTKRIHGFDIYQADAIKQVKNTKIPILYIHGKEDYYVPIENMINLYNSTPENLRQKYLVDDAGHAMSYAVAGVLYEKKISDFLKSRTNL